jgi:hypothetical protein
MSAYYIHDGRNEIGPFTIDLLKKQKLTRTTPIRQLGSDNWMPAERLIPVKEMVVPRKIKKPKDVIPAVKEHFADLQQRKPRMLYGGLLCFALLAGISIFSITTKAIRQPVIELPVKPQVSLVQPAPVEGVSPSNKVEEKKIPVVAEDKAKTSRSRWTKLISATNSNYGIGFLGGIKDLSVSLTNRTDFPINMAVVKVTYIKAGGGVWKTIPVTLYNIPAHDTKEQAMPDVNRGKKVKVSIQKIVSKQMNFSYTEGQKIRNPADPYVL